MNPIAPAAGDRGTGFQRGFDSKRLSAAGMPPAQDSGHIEMLNVVFVRLQWWSLAEVKRNGNVADGRGEGGPNGRIACRVDVDLLMGFC